MTSNRAQRHWSDRHLGEEQRRRCASAQAVALMGTLPILEAQIGLQVPLQLGRARIVGTPESHPPQFGQDGPLQPFDEPKGYNFGQWFPVYDWVVADGYNNFATWVG